ncbi:MAG: hypothetical protein NT154_13185 [Verrucomicrobia bacterium]|nr:hypothetical protein [Verrucomicrobiota bacterium]
MTESKNGIDKASPARLASVLALDTDSPRVWRPEELGAVFQHQMASPVSVDLGSLDPGLTGKLRTLTDASGLLLKSFRDLFQHPAPPLELLRLVTDFAKLNREQRESLLPSDVATVLYYLSIAAALVRWDERISALSDDELRRGFAWANSQNWIDEPARELLGSASEKLPSSRPNP